MGCHKIGIASVESIRNAILEILGDLKTEREEGKRNMEDEKEFEMRIIFENVRLEPSIEATFNLAPIAIVCVATCVNCNRSYETKPRSRNETSRKVLCVKCQRSYERGQQ